MVLSRMLQLDGYEIQEVREVREHERVEVYLYRRDDKPFECHRCRSRLLRKRGTHRLRLREMDVFGHQAFIHVDRLKGDCPSCKKARSEHIEFVADESPHLTKNLAWWLGRLSEISPVSRAGELVGENRMTMWRVDLKRMKRMLEGYSIPRVTEISVDEVYIRNKPVKGESRDDRFFTIITDLKSRRVVWVEESRRKEALDAFFQRIGKERCEKIKIVACDQHRGYKLSVQEYCKNATLVWDRFHIMKKFEEAVNDTRKLINEKLIPSSKNKLYQLTRGKHRFIFLKKDSRRTKDERKHLSQVQKENRIFIDLELIKERMLTFFDQRNEEDALGVLNQIGDWIFEAGFPHLKKWYRKISTNWNTLRNYFLYRVTSALSEGTNNVIKAIKRRAFGFRNMEYCRLKILQVCGLLNSRYMDDDGSLTKRAVQLMT